MKIVQFKNGNYGIQETDLFGLIRINRFVDLKRPDCRWSNRDYSFKDCQSPDLEEVKKVKDYIDLRGIKVVE